MQLCCHGNSWIHLATPGYSQVSPVWTPAVSAPALFHVVNRMTSQKQTDDVTGCLFLGWGGCCCCCCCCCCCYCCSGLNWNMFFNIPSTSVYRGQINNCSLQMFTWIQTLFQFESRTSNHQTAVQHPFRQEVLQINTTESELYVTVSNCCSF